MKRSFKFPDRKVLIEGDRRTGKTTKCAEIVVQALVQNKAVLVVHGAPMMCDIFQYACRDAADKCGIDHLISWFKLDVHVMGLGSWTKPDLGKVYDVIVFVDGPPEPRPTFNGLNWVFNLGPELWQVLDFHARHVTLANNTLPEFVVSCNPENLLREPAQIFLEELADIQHGGKPEKILAKLAELQKLHIDVATIIASKLTPRLA